MFVGAVGAGLPNLAALPNACLPADRPFTPPPPACTHPPPPPPTPPHTLPHTLSLEHEGSLPLLCRLQLLLQLLLGGGSGFPIGVGVLWVGVGAVGG